MVMYENGKVNKIGKCSRTARKLEDNDHGFKVRIITMIFPEHIQLPKCRFEVSGELDLTTQ